MNVKILAISGFVLLALGYGIGRYVQPANIKEVEKEVVKTQHDVVTVVKEIKRPDGTIEKEIRTEDKTSKEKSKESVVEIKNNKPDWKVHALYGKNIDDMKDVYGIQVDRRIMANISVSVWGNTSKTIGIGIGYEF